MTEKDGQHSVVTRENGLDVYEENGVHHKVSTKHPCGKAGIQSNSNPQMNLRLFLSLTAMSFLWVGSQIPLYLFGSVVTSIYQDIGGYDRYPWFVIGYLIPNAALCPFVGALSDLFGRRMVAVAGQLCLIIGPVITATANTMNIAIGEYRSSTRLLASATDFIFSWAGLLWTRCWVERAHRLSGHCRASPHCQTRPIRRCGGFHHPAILSQRGLCATDHRSLQLAV